MEATTGAEEATEAHKPGEGLCFAWPLTKAVQSLKPAVRKDQRDKWLSQAFQDHGILEPPDLWAFGDFVVHHPSAVQFLQQKLNLRLLVVKTTRYKQFNVPKLLYDGRHGIFENAEQEETAHMNNRMTMMSMTSMQTMTTIKSVEEKPED